MTWEELEKKHEEQWQKLEQEQNNSYEQLREKHEELRNAFYGTEVDMPLEIKQRMENEFETWNENYKADSEKIVALKQAQAKERLNWTKLQKFKEYLNGLELKEESRMPNNEYEL